MEAVEAAEAPFGVGDLADEDEFEDVFGEEVVFELLEEAVVVGGVFVGHNGVAGEESVFESVLGGAGFALGGARAG